jgi:GAF domain-containing protein
MRRRSRAGGEPVKTRRRKTATLKRRNAPKPTLDRRLSAAVLQEQLDRRTRELNEALEQQTATADVLQVISRSAFDLEAVLNTLVESAARLCEADRGVILRPTGKKASYYSAAWYGHTPEYIEHTRTLTLEPGRGGVNGRVLLEGRSVQIPDVLADSDYIFLETARLGNFRTILGVPLLREGIPVGIFNLHRAAVRPFTDKQIKLVETFADQAVIAIENTRLLNELRESLQQQTATADVLKVISRSTFDLQAVLSTLIESAARLCAAEMGGISLRDGDVFQVIATYGYSPEAERYAIKHPLLLDRGTATGRAALEGRAVHVLDVLADPEYRESGHQKAVGYRTILAVPLLRDGTTIGVFALTRREVHPFIDKQIELITTFADQAAIAIENVRLFEAEQERTRELTESLEQQTATSEVLQVISSSPGNLSPVFEAMLEKAIRICDAKIGGIYRCDGDVMRLVATTHNLPAAYRDAISFSPFRPGPKHIFGHMMATKTVVHISDAAKEQGYLERRPEMVAAVDLGGGRTLLVVPMLKDNEPIGACWIARQEVRSFTEKQIALVQNFAAQAVIAIENARLLNELRESLQQQTATADVLKVISRSTFDLQLVLDTLVESAARLCEADQAQITRPQSGGLFWLQATFGYSKELKDELERLPFRSGTETITGRALLARAPVHILDAQTDPGYELTKAQKLGGYRTILAAPMLREGEPIGVIGLGRHSVRPFTQRQIELLATFAEDCHREREAAQRTARIAGATDGHRRRAQGHQPLDLRSPDRAGYVDRVGCTTVRR